MAGCGRDPVDREVDRILKSLDRQEKKEEAGDATRAYSSLNRSGRCLIVPPSYQRVENRRWARGIFGERLDLGQDVLDAFQMNILLCWD